MRSILILRSSAVLLLCVAPLRPHRGLAPESRMVLFANISPQGRGYALTPGIYDDAQVEGWRQVTEAVHAR
jgi:hypothetical protein